MGFQPGELVQEIFKDPKTGVRHDARGNVIPDCGPQNYETGVAYYTANGQPLRYAVVYPGPVNVHVNKSLTDFSVAYEIDSGLFVASTISPIKTVDKRSNTYFIVSRDDVGRNYGNKLVRAVGAAANEIDQGFDTDTYLCVDYAIRDFVPDKVASNADQALQLMQQTTEFVTKVMEMGYERRIIAAQFDTATFTNSTFATATTGGSGSIASATATNRYIHQAFNTAITAVSKANNGRTPTHVVMSPNEARRIAATAEIADQVKYQVGKEYIISGGFAGRNYGLPDQLYGLNVAIAGAVGNSAVRGQTGNFDFLLSGQIGFFIVEQSGLKTHNAVTTFRNGGLTIRTYRDEARKGTWVEAEMDQDENVTNPYGGYLLTSA